MLGQVEQYTDRKSCSSQGSLKTSLLLFSISWMSTAHVDRSKLIFELDLLVLRINIEQLANAVSSVTSDNLKFSIVRDISTLSLSLCHFIIHLWLVRLFLLTHVLRPLHFKHRIKGILRPSTNANLCYLKFNITNCSWEKNRQNCKISAIRSVEVAK